MRILLSPKNPKSTPTRGDWLERVGGIFPGQRRRATGASTNALPRLRSGSLLPFDSRTSYDDNAKHPRPNQAVEFLVERVGGIEPPTQPWEGRVLPLNHTRAKRLVVYLLVLFVASGLVGVHGTTATETPAFDYTAEWVAWGKTFETNGGKAGIFPNGIVAPGQVTWTVHEGSLPALPPNRQILGTVYRLSIDGDTRIDSAQPRPIAVAIPFGSSKWIRQIWVYDLDAKIWNPLPTKLNTTANLGQAPSGIQRGLYAILEDRNQLEGTASYYCVNNCTLSAQAYYAATNAFPIGTKLRVRNLQTGQSIVVEVVSTWAGTSPHVIDLHISAFAAIGGTRSQGIIKVNIQPASVAQPKVLGATSDFSLGKVERLPTLTLQGNNGVPFPTISPRPFAVYDQTTNRLLAWHRKDDIVPIASITKLMTAAVFLDTQPSLNTVITYQASDMTPYAYLKVAAGDTMTLRDLFYSLLVGSANNAAPALVRATGMTQEQFVAKMNAKAKAWGLGRTTFADVHGLSPANVSTAEEVARMSAQIFHDYEPVRYVTVRREYSFRTLNTGVPHRLVTTDDLLGSGRVSSELIFTGGKTGYLDEAKYTYVIRAANKAQGTQVVTALLASPSSAARFTDGAAILNWAFANHRWAP